MAGLLGQHS